MQAWGSPATLPSASQRRDMVERNAFTDQQIQDYIDARLNERDRGAVTAYLLAHPRVAADVEAVRRQSEALRALGHAILDEPVPKHLRRILREHPARARAELSPLPPAPRQPARHIPGFLAIAAALLFCAGGAVGWFAHGVVGPIPSAKDMVLADVNRAHAFYGARDYPAPFPADRAEEFVRWIGRSFAREVRPPNLDEFGYRYRGGRVLPSAGGNVGLFQFERRDNTELAVFFWTTGAPPRLDLDNLAARLWSMDGISFAVVSDHANRDLNRAASAIFAFYGEALGSD
jgi:anti-sigma factor RsiW